MGRLAEDKALRERMRIFRDREETGILLGEKIIPLVGSRGTILAIPSGLSSLPLAEQPYLNLCYHQ
jgi:hypothetical protein